MFMMPPFLLALECGQVALLLGLKLTDADLYLTVFFQIQFRESKMRKYLLRDIVEISCYPDSKTNV